jgi:hypothetical protein
MPTYESLQLKELMLMIESFEKKRENFSECRQKENFQVPVMEIFL